MNIRRNIFYKMNGNTQQIKAIALLLFVKDMFVSSTITNYSHNKLHEVSGLHINTIKDRIKTLKAMGLVKMEKSHMVFKPIQSHSKHRNIDLSKITFGSVKDIEKSLYVMFVVEIQKHKDFAKHTIQTIKTSKKLQEVKDALKARNRYGYSKEYKEYGLSYNTIAKRLKISIQKAFNIICFAVKNKMLEKTNHCKQFFVGNASRCIKYTNIDNYTFYTKDNIYKVYANTYSIL